MLENTPIFESLLEKAAEYGQTSFKLIKLRTLDKISEGVSSFIPHGITLVLIILSLLFINLGLALWLGELMGKIYFGFLLAGAFYLFIGLLFHFVFNRYIKNKIRDYMINKALN